MSFGIGVGDILKLCEVASRVYKNCRDCTGEYKNLTSDARNLTNLLEDIGDKYDTIPESKKPSLRDAYGACVEVLYELDKTLLHYNSLDTKSKRAWDRLKWDPEKSRALRERLTASVVLLNGFYNSLIHDSQVLILQALARLERDYRGGHREESIASVQRITSVAEDENDVEDEEEAWSQIIRDLEDVGITPRDALEYREFIIDWFIRAVNEGRLMEDEHRKQRGLDTMTRELSTILPATSPREDLAISTKESNCSVSGKSETQTPPMTEQCASQGSASKSRVHHSFATVPAETPAGLASSESESTSAPHGPHIPTFVPSPPSFDPRFDVDTENPDWDATPPNAAVVGSVTTRPFATQDLLLAPRDNLLLRARKIIAAWQKTDWDAASRYLEEQLTAVEQGETTTLQGKPIQPDRRILRYMIGVCASNSGSFVKAKNTFESIFNGIYLNGSNLDEGDIAAARWLGDVCLHLHEPHNTALAWGVAFNGLIARYGENWRVTQCVGDELHTLERELCSVSTLEKPLRLNMDPSDVFLDAHLMEKHSLVTSLADRLANRTYSRLFVNFGRPAPQWAITEEILIGHIPGPGLWPLAWDPTFVPIGAIRGEKLMPGIVAKANRGTAPLSAISLPTVSFVRAKELHYLTRLSQAWLVETVKAALQYYGIEYREAGTSLICRSNQQRSGLAYCEGALVKFKKLQFRNMYGIKLSTEWVTRIEQVTGPYPVQEDEWIRRITGYLKKEESDPFHGFDPFLEHPPEC